MSNNIDEKASSSITHPSLVATTRVCGEQGSDFVHGQHRHQLSTLLAGRESWGNDQCRMIRTAVDRDERLTIKDVATGAYDAKLTDSTGRKYTVKNIDVTEGKVFSIAEKQLTDCQK
jgi:hypothetical protein